MSAIVKKTTKTDSLRNAFSHFILLITAGFGLLTTLTLIEEPSRMLEPNFAISAARGPASVVEPTVNDKSFISTLNLSCDLQDGLKTSSEHVRLKSEACNWGLQEIAVKNMTNGMAATVFLQNGTGFTTDYIALNAGVNKIVIEGAEISGQKLTKEIQITRE